MTVEGLIAVLQTMPQKYPVYMGLYDCGCVERYPIEKVETCAPNAFFDHRVEICCHKEDE